MGSHYGVSDSDKDKMSFQSHMIVVNGKSCFQDSVVYREFKSTKMYRKSNTWKGKYLCLTPEARLFKLMSNFVKKHNMAPLMKSQVQV